MNVNVEPTAAEDLSDRSNSSNSESQLHAFQEYGKIKELNLSINKVKDSSTNKMKDFNFAMDGSRQHGFPFSNLASVDRSAKDLPMALDKPKEFDFQHEKIKDASNYSLDRSEDADASLDTTNLSGPKDGKDVLFSFDGIKDVHFPREVRDTRIKNVHFPVDRNKDLNFQKAYNHPLDRIKDFNFALDRRRDSHVGGLALERLRGGSFLEPADYRNLQIQPRDELEAIAVERMRRSHILASDIVPRNLPAHLPHPHSITDMQHSQQQQQQQGKSFTIDSILGLRNNQREKQQRSQQHPYRKHQGQEGSVKNDSSGSSLSSSGKLKRVRTIFTAEQLERLEGEFARQQYMVGPERLYLAHALKLTEAQVKVWFQNRRIKWRKVHHEQQSQRLHELHSLSSLEQDVEDSNDNSDCREVFRPAIPRALDSLKILDTISEHTEPSPVPSMTMDQADLEAQSQSRKLRRGRHSSSYWPTWASRLPADGVTASDSYWKNNPRLTHSVPHSHEQRRQEYGSTEPVTSSYSASNTYRPKHRTLTSVLPKPQHTPIPDQNYRATQHSARATRNKLLTTNNVAIVRKPCYKEEPDEDEEVKYDDEDVNYAEENGEDEGAEDVDEDQDETYEYCNDKDYDEQEADDEVDDESDAFQSQLHRVQHKALKASNQRAQHLRHTEQHHDLRKSPHQQHIHKMYQEQKLPRYYSQASEPQQPTARDTSYGDVPEVVSEEEPTPPYTPPRRSSRRTPDSTQRVLPHWSQPRKSLERNRERLSSPLMTVQQQQQQRQFQQRRQQERQHQHQQQLQQQQHQLLRKHRTTKPELESLMVPQPSNTAAKKCCICGGSTAPIVMKSDSSRKGNCRLHEYRGITVKGPPGENGEAEEQVVCGRCVKRHNMDDVRLGYDVASSEVPFYAEKPHRARIHRSSAYDYPEDNQTVDDMLAAYASSQPRASTLGHGVTFPKERTRHSVQSTKSPMRRASYYEQV